MCDALICRICRGEGTAEFACENCAGTGREPTDENAFGQCHTCYGDGVAEQICFRCSGSGIEE